jgi:ribosomal protein S18 acetylase RimI-like enzyme
MDVPATDLLTWRPVDQGDAALLHPLIEAIGAADDAEERYTVDDVADEVGVPWLRLALDTVIGLDEAGTARAFGLVQVRPGDESLLRITCFGGVHPEHRRRGIGRALLDWQLSRGRALVAARRAELASRPPAVIFLDVDEAIDDAAHLAAAAGLRVARWFTVMRRSLDGELPPVVVPTGLTLQPWSPDLDDAVRLAHNEAFVVNWGFQPWTADSWREWESGHRNFRPDWSFVVTDADRVAGYAMSAGYDQDWTALGFSEGWTGKLGVREPWRERGLARALLAASMAAFARSGIASAGLSVDSENRTGAVALYTGLGYRPVRRTATWTLDV